VQLPTWFTQLKWNGPASVATLDLERKALPDFPGCYAFTIGKAALVAGQVLYVGQASTSLRQRVGSYLVDYKTPRTSRGHKGKGFILDARSRSGDHGVYLRWVEYGGNRHDLDILEASLINLLNPAANDREDDTRHPLLGQHEQLDPRLIF
jgi:hypothetical protein